MAIEIKCACGLGFVPPDDAVGRPVQCPSCGAQIPTSDRPATCCPIMEALCQVGDAVDPSSVLRVLHWVALAGLFAALLNGLIGAASSLYVTIHTGQWSSLFFAPASLLVFGLLGLLGYVCARGSLQHVTPVRSGFLDSTAIYGAALLSTVMALVSMKVSIQMGRMQEYGGMAFFFTIFLVLMLLAAGWIWPQAIGVQVLAASRDRRWGLLDHVLALSGLLGRMILVAGVLLFGLVGCGAVLSQVLRAVRLEGGKFGDALALLSESNSVITNMGSMAMLAAIPFLAHVAWLLLQALTELIRVWIATEDNTRRPPSK
jgi:hypothetical protein